MSALKKLPLKREEGYVWGPLLAFDLLFSGVTAQLTFCS